MTDRRVWKDRQGKTGKLIDLNDGCYCRVLYVVEHHRKEAIDVFRFM